jgi:hypothetical protein
MPTRFGTLATRIFVIYRGVCTLGGAQAGKSRTPASASQTRSATSLPSGCGALDELLPEIGGLNHATTRNRTLAVGKRIEEEIRGEIDHPRVVPEPAERMVVGIDGAFVKARHTRAGQRHQVEILTGRIEASQRGCFYFETDATFGTAKWEAVVLPWHSRSQLRSEEPSSKASG